MAEKKASKRKASTRKTSGSTRKVGRPTVMTEETLRKLEQGFLMGLSDTKCCAFADISTTALYEYCTKHPKFAERKELLKNSPAIQAQINVVTAINNGDEDMSKWYLERKCKEEFSLRQEVGLSGNVNNPLEGFTTEELRKMIADD